MLRGLYTAATAMLANSRKMDVITNNLTNSETVGFKQETMTTRSFQDMLISRLNDPSVYQYSYVGPHNLGIHVDQVFTDFTTGSFTETNNQTDLALATDGFFVVDYFPPGLTEEEADETEPEQRYIRGGNFALDTDGYLVTPDGYYVHDLDDMPIYIGTQDFSVSREGIITANGEEMATLRVVRFEDNSVLRKTGDNLFSVYTEVDEFGDALPAAEPETVEIPDIRQGFLETSNVDVAREMVRMMETYRSYEVNQRVINMFDESLRLSVNEIARF
ncbi:MAG: flagellar hook-basal body protein [Oscillospiraceae bacterium]|nr:flagellar hook-basal body protein [Oscillospiraceae bacterium]